jgi:hypothetical protein
MYTGGRVTGVPHHACPHPRGVFHLPTSTPAPPELKRSVVGWRLLPQGVYIASMVGWPGPFRDAHPGRDELHGPLFLRRLQDAIVNDFQVDRGERQMNLSSLPVAFGVDTAKYICAATIDVTRLSRLCPCLFAGLHKPVRAVLTCPCSTCRCIQTLSRVSACNSAILPRC